MNTPPSVGDKAPAFQLPDATGAQRNLTDLAAKGKLVLLFFRGVW
jgi:peroxiredoxin